MATGVRPWINEVPYRPTAEQIGPLVADFLAQRGEQPPQAAPGDLAASDELARNGAWWELLIALLIRAGYLQNGRPFWSRRWTTSSTDNPIEWFGKEYLQHLADPSRGQRIVSAPGADWTIVGCELVAAALWTVRKHQLFVSDRVLVAFQSAELDEEIRFLVFKAPAAPKGYRRIYLLALRPGLEEKKLRRWINSEGPWWELVIDDDRRRPRRVVSIALANEPR